jgi:hypothetical protein
MQPTIPLAFTFQLFQQIPDLIRKGSNALRCCPIGKAGVHPQCAKHLHQMGFTGSEESAHPGSRLFGLANIAQKGLQNNLQSMFVLPITDKGFKLISEYIKIM